MVVFIEVIIILVLNALAFLFAMGVNFSTGIIVVYLKTLGATEFIISISAAAVYMSRGTGSMIIHKITKYISFKKLFMITFLGSAFGTFIYLFPQNPLLLALLRFVQGFFSGFFSILIIVYSMNTGTRLLTNFKSLSIVTIFLNVGGFIGSFTTGKIASIYSPQLSFYINIIILIIGFFICFFLKDMGEIKDYENINKPYFPNKLKTKEKYIIIFALFAYAAFAFITIGIPLAVLEIGGSYEEIATMSALGILSAIIILSISPNIKKNFSYKSIMIVDYTLVIVSFLIITYFKNISVIYIFYAILIGIVALEKNLWYAILKETSKNYTRVIGLLRFYLDYLGTISLLSYGVLIQNFGAFKIIFISISIVSGLLFSMIFIKKYNFLSKHKAIIKKTTQFKSTLYKVNI